MVSWGSLGRWLQGIDYKLVVPALAGMPLWAGEKLASLRGFFAWLLNHDWRYVASGSREARARTYQSMSIIDPEAGPARLNWRTLRRFQHNSREEWQACLFNKKVMEKINNNSMVTGLEELKYYRSQGRGVILVSCHLDSFCMGMVLLGLQGLPVHVINTSEIENPVIHPNVREFYQAKYRAMENLMHGRMAYYQTEMDHFREVLKHGEMVTLMGDVPGSRSTIYIPFLGRLFRMPLGAWHLARETDSALGAYVCVREGTGRYRVICMNPGEILSDDPKQSLLPVYDFLEKWIRRMPERWISADLLSGFPQLPADEREQDRCGT